MLDCCRTYSLPRVLKSKASSAASKGLAPMCPTTSTLIAFACAPGTVAIDGSPNNRNGLFTFHLLKHVTRPGKDIIDIVTDVGYEVSKSSKERQLPHVTYGPMPRGVFLVSTQNETTQSNSRQGDYNSVFI
ncbi:unnamed protein product [Rotaria magnacalcarata]|nr:unnamed protein product [Rotaria magnacalcarata]CAF4442228.1 unnamed protein product [Rotaria magnacalcarata]